jgi:hypothetical protein
MAPKRKSKSKEVVEPGQVRQPYIVAVDPGSRSVGVAVVDTSNAQVVCWQHIAAKSTAVPFARVRAIASELFLCVDEYIDAGALVIVETPGGASAFRGGRGLVTLGLSVGYFVALLDRMCEQRDARVETVDVAVWSRLGCSKPLPKEERAEYVAEVVGDAYDPSDDPKLDAIDAIGLALWRGGFLEVVEEAADADD